MGQAKQRKAEIDALKSQGPRPNIRKGTGFQHTPHNFGGVTGIMFDYNTEFQKAATMVLSDPPSYDVKSTRADYNAMGFGSAGFLMALVPAKKLLGGQALGWFSKITDADRIREVVAGFHKECLTDDWVLMKTYITRDLAFQKFEELHDVLHSAFIAYSTPENISTLSEDKDFIRAYSEGFDPSEVSVMTACKVG